MKENRAAAYEFFVFGGLGLAENRKVPKYKKKQQKGDAGSAGKRKKQHSAGNAKD